MPSMQRLTTHIMRIVALLALGSCSWLCLCRPRRGSGLLCQWGRIAPPITPPDRRPERARERDAGDTWLFAVRVTEREISDGLGSWLSYV